MSGSALVPPTAAPRYYAVGLEHLAFEVDTVEEVDADQPGSSRIHR